MGSVPTISTRGGGGGGERDSRDSLLVMKLA